MYLGTPRCDQWWMRFLCDFLSKYGRLYIFTVEETNLGGWQHLRISHISPAMLDILNISKLYNYDLFWTKSMTSSLLLGHLQSRSVDLSRHKFTAGPSFNHVNSFTISPQISQQLYSNTLGLVVKPRTLSKKPFDKVCFVFCSMAKPFNQFSEIIEIHPKIPLL